MAWRTRLSFAWNGVLKKERNLHIFLLHLSGLIVCFRMEQLGFLYSGNYTESFTPRGNYTELSDSLSQPSAYVSLCRESHLIVEPSMHSDIKEITQFWEYLFHQNKFFVFCCLEMCFNNNLA